LKLRIPAAKEKGISVDSFVNKRDWTKQEQGSKKKTDILLPP